MTPADCASGCKGCRTCRARRKRAKWWANGPLTASRTTPVMTMQHRLYDCYWQMRMPELELGSDVSVALISYLTNLAKGGEIAVPGLKR